MGVALVAMGAGLAAGVSTVVASEVGSMEVVSEVASAAVVSEVASAAVDSEAASAVVDSISLPVGCMAGALATEAASDANSDSMDIMAAILTGAFMVTTTMAAAITKITSKSLAVAAYLWSYRNASWKLQHRVTRGALDELA
jgi:hypothetical protein